MDDIELVAWFPNQSKKTEQQIKKQWKQHRIYGKSEWLPADKLDEVLKYLENLEPNRAHMCDHYEAILTRRRI